MKLSDFDYYLPENLIAQTPITPRSASRLMIYDRQTKQVSESRFDGILEQLKKGDVLVVNNTRVLPARLLGKTQGGGKMEFLLLKRKDKDVFEVMVKPGKRAKLNSVITFSDKLKAEVLGVTDFGGRLVRFICDGIFEEVLNEIGLMPLPHYIKETLQDKERYQTVYSKEKGSAAAPTAGLHFTEELIAAIKQKGVIFTEVLLHVGLGTFRPVKTENVLDHKMHSEYYEIKQSVADTINLAHKENRRVIAVGTTVVRVLESAAGSGGKLQGAGGETDIFIYPGYNFKCVDALITNFHLPKSTLLMLVSAFAGREETLGLYEQAVRQQYRFFSFGDAMFIK